MFYWRILDLFEGIEVYRRIKSTSSSSCRLFVRDKKNVLIFLIDTGADVSVIPKKFLNSFKLNTNV